MDALKIVFIQGIVLNGGIRGQKKLATTTISFDYFNTNWPDS